MKTWRHIKRILIDTALHWWRHAPSQMGAATAYYALFSIAPLLFLVMTVAGILIGRANVEHSLFISVSQVVGPGPAGLMRELVREVSRPSVTSIGGIVGTAVLLIGALGLLSQIQWSLEHLWGHERGRFHFLTFIKKKFIALVTIIVLGIVLALSLIINISFAVLAPLLTRLHVIGFVPMTTAVASFLIAVCVFILIFRYLPQVTLHWGAVLAGALFTGIIFSFGKLAIAYYLSHTSLVTSFGAFGAIVVLIVWVYYSAQAFFFGAAFAYVIDRKIRSGMIR